MVLRDLHLNYLYTHGHKNLNKWCAVRLYFPISSFSSWMFAHTWLLSSIPTIMYWQTCTKRMKKKDRKIGLAPHHQFKYYVHDCTKRNNSDNAIVFVEREQLCVSAERHTATPNLTLMRKDSSSRLQIYVVSWVSKLQSLSCDNL